MAVFFKQICNALNAFLVNLTRKGNEGREARGGGGCTVGVMLRRKRVFTTKVNFFAFLSG